MGVADESFEDFVTRMKRLTPAGLGAEVDQARQLYSDNVTTAIRVCREKHRVGDPLAMPCMAMSVQRAITALAPDNPGTQLWLATNMLADAVVRMAENESVVI